MAGHPHDPDDGWNPHARDFNDAPKGAERSSPMAEQNTPTAESLIEGLGEAVSPDKAPYSRLVVGGKTLAYASARRDGVLLDIAGGVMEDAPARFQKMLEHHNGRATLRVTAKNAKGARSLLEWVAKQITA